MKGPHRVAIYARVSTAEQNVGLQLDELRQAVSQRGWRLHGEYVDKGISGAETQREALGRLLADAQAGLFQGVVVWKLDRLGRSLQHLLSVLDDLAGWGVDFTSLRDSGMDTTTPSGRLMLQLLGAFAEFERALIQERVIAGVRRAQANGIHCGRPKVEIDLRPAVAMLEKGHGLGVTAKAMGVARSTLRRRLMEAGGWSLKA